MKRTQTTKILLGIMSILPFVITAVMYSRLPEQIPFHWDLNGTASYTAKYMIWLMAALPLILTVLGVLMPRLDPKQAEYKRFTKSYDTFFVVLDVVMLSLLLMTIAESIHPHTVDVKTCVTVMIGVLFTVTGNLMPKFKHNYFIGVRTPWTLASEAVWYRTHRMAAIVWFIGGLVMIVLAFLPAKLTVVLLLCDVAVIILLPTVMSYIWGKQEK